MRTRLLGAVISALVLVGSAGCTSLFHKPRPDLDRALEERPWRVRCSWILPAPGASLKPGESGFVWASDAAGRRLVLEGQLEDGFLVVERARAASDRDERDIEFFPARTRDLRQACNVAVDRETEGKRPQLYAVMAAREGEEVEVPMVLPHDPALPRPVSRMVVFGDSLSDAGNLKRRLLVFPRPPYWQGRFSNGPNWTDYLHDRTGIAVENQAYGGAVAVKHDDAPVEGVIAAVEQKGQFFLTGSVRRQVSDYLERDLHGGTVRKPREVVFVIWAGSIDYMMKEPFSGDIATLLDNPKGQAGYQAVVRTVVESIAEQVGRLHAAGARQFVIVNLPDIGKSPIVVQNKSYQPARRPKSEAERRLLLARKLSELSKYHNDQLAQAVATLTRALPDVKIVHVDMAAFMSQVLANRAGTTRFDYGYALRPREVEVAPGRRFQDRCYTGGYLGSTDPATVCAEAHNALFWDVVHPTSYAHCWLAFVVQRELARAGLASAPASLDEQRAYCTARNQPIPSMQ